MTDPYRKVQCPTCGKVMWFPNDGRETTVDHYNPKGMLKYVTHVINRSSADAEARREA